MTKPSPRSPAMIVPAAFFPFDAQAAAVSRLP